MPPTGPCKLFGAPERLDRFADVPIDDLREQRIFLLGGLQGAWLVELLFALHEPGLRSRRTVERLGLCMYDNAAFLPADLGRVPYTPVPAFSLADRAHFSSVPRRSIGPKK